MNKRRFKTTLKYMANAQRMMWQLDRTVCVTAAAIGLVDAVMPFIGIYLSAYVLDGLEKKQDMQSLMLTAVLAVGGIFLLQLLKSYLNKVQQVHIDICVFQYEKKRSERTLTMDYELLESPMVNKIRDRVKNDNNWGSGFYSVIWALPGLVSGTLSAVIAFCVVLPLFWQEQGSFDVLTLAVLAVFLIVVFWQNQFLTKKRKKTNEYLNNSHNRGMKWIGYYLWRDTDYKSGKDIRIFGGQQMIEEAVDTDYACQKEYFIKPVIKNESEKGFAQGGFAGLLQILAYIFVALRACAGSLSVGSVVKYASSVYQFATAVSSVFGSFSNYAIAAERQQSTLEYMNVQDVLYKGTLPVEKRDDNEYEIEFHDVSFRYPGTDTYALEHVNFKFAIGERLAVVGMNGSGKTTLIKLLCRLYDPTEGVITLNGVDIKKYDYTEYLSIFSVVFQDFSLFSYTLGQNVAASVEYDKARAEDALCKAGFGERLTELPKQLDTSLYQNLAKDGVEISGGEAQKIALARAIYKDAPFVVLDEPTAALDPVAEYEIYTKFNEIVGQKTAIYISHRLSSCRFCDDIAVFDKGRLVQRGSHDQLVSDRQGKYHELWHAQAQYYA